MWGKYEQLWPPFMDELKLFIRFKWAASNFHLLNKIQTVLPIALLGFCLWPYCENKVSLRSNIGAEQMDLTQRGQQMDWAWEQGSISPNRLSMSHSKNMKRLLIVNDIRDTGLFLHWISRAIFVKSMSIHVNKCDKPTWHLWTIPSSWDQSSAFRLNSAFVL